MRIDSKWGTKGKTSRNDYSMHQKAAFAFCPKVVGLGSSQSRFFTHGASSRILQNRTVWSKPSRRRAFASTVSARAALPWQPEFEAAVLNREVGQELPLLVPTTPAPTKPTRGLTVKRIKRLLSTTWRLAAPFWRSDRTARWHALSCALLHVCNSAFGAVFTELSGNLITALNERNVSGFSTLTLQLFGLCMLAVPISAFTSFVRSTLILRWQQFLTKRGLGLYFEESNYYKLANLTPAKQNDSLSAEEEEPDNPDEVIDLRFSDFASNMVDIAMDNLRTVVEICIYSVMLLRIFPPLYLCILGIVGIGMVLINRIGRQLVDLEALLQRRAADFRFALARIRIHAESIAFYNGSRFERRNADRKLDAQAETTLGLEKTRIPVNMFTNSFYYLPTVLPLLLLGPLYFSKKIQLGQLTKSTSAFNVLFDNLSIFVGDYGRYAFLGASIERLSKFVSALEGNKEPSTREFGLPAPPHSGNGLLKDSGTHAEKENSKISFCEVSGLSALDLRHVCVDAPVTLRRILVDVTLSLQPGSRLLIVGRSGRGKTSLLRAIAGLWTSGSGTICRPPRSEMFFMPQRPYCVQGTLRQQLLYPNLAATASDEELETSLRRVGLPDLSQRVGGLDVMQDWAEYLSAGENQRLAFARLLIAKPSLVLVDEGTSALDLPTEEKLMRLVKDLDCTLVSVGHRPSLVKFHDSVLHLKDGIEDGGWYKIVPAGQFSTEEMMG